MKTHKCEQVGGWRVTEQEHSGVIYSIENPMIQTTPLQEVGWRTVAGGWGGRWQVLHEIPNSFVYSIQSSELGSAKIKKTENWGAWSGVGSNSTPSSPVSRLG